MNSLPFQAVVQRPPAKHSCDYCDYRTANRTHLKDHVRTHTKSKPYRCALCGYRFTKECTLKAHLRIHTGEKPHRCDQCDYRTANNSDLHVHKRRWHTGEKPYACHLENCDYQAAKRPISLRTFESIRVRSRTSVRNANIERRKKASSTVTFDANTHFSFVLLFVECVKPM